MPETRERIAELYFRSGSAQFGRFPLSIHVDHPELPLSPFYLHYPKPGEAGTEHLPELFELIGAEFYDLAEAASPPFRPRRLAGLPNGALPLGDAHARHYSDYPNNLVVFRKVSMPGRTIIEGPVAGVYEAGDVLCIDDDHTSGGRNKLLALDAARRAGFIVTRMFTAVDREQGATANLKEANVDLVSIFTATELLTAGAAMGFASQAQLDEAIEYMASNQYALGQQ